MTYKSFILEQVNFQAKRGPDWKVWEDETFPSRDLPPLEAAKCAALQGEETFRRFHLLLFRARHQKKLDITNQLILLDVAKEAGLDGERFARDLKGRGQREVVAREHLEAVEKFGIFGVPTLIFDDGMPLFVKLKEGRWEGSEREDLELLERLRQLSMDQPYVLEVKQPESAFLAEASEKRYRIYL